MQKLSSQPRALLYPIILQYETVSGNTVSYTSLNKLTLLQLETQFINSPNTLKVTTIVKALTNKQDIDKLIYRDVDILYKLIMDSSTISSTDVNDINEALLVLQDPKYSTEDFQSCKICQERGLDKRRNCPLLDESTHNKKLIPYTFKDNPNKITRVCPMGKVNNSSEVFFALELMGILELGVLPMSGGMLEQTMFVNEVSKLVKPLIDKKNIPMML